MASDSSTFVGSMAGGASATGSIAGAVGEIDGDSTLGNSILGASIFGPSLAASRSLRFSMGPSSELGRSPIANHVRLPIGYQFRTVPPFRLASRFRLPTP